MLFFLLYYCFPSSLTTVKFINCYQTIYQQKGKINPKRGQERPMFKKVLTSNIVLTSDETRLVLNQFFSAWVTFTRHVSCWPEVNNEEKKRTRDFLRLGRQTVGQHGASINKNRKKTKQQRLAASK